jgi:hypothetical protein
VLRTSNKRYPIYIWCDVEMLCESDCAFEGLCVGLEEAYSCRVVGRLDIRFAIMISISCGNLVRIRFFESRVVFSGSDESHLRIIVQSRKVEYCYLSWVRQCCVVNIVVLD